MSSLFWRVTSASDIKYYEAKSYEYSTYEYTNGGRRDSLVNEHKALCTQLAEHEVAKLHPAHPCDAPHPIIRVSSIVIL